MIPLLARHIINGMDARYNTIYVEHRDSEDVAGRDWRAFCSSFSHWYVCSGPALDADYLRLDGAIRSHCCSAA